MHTSQIGSAARALRSAPPPAEARPTPRFAGPVAELAALQARLRNAQSAGDDEAEARLSVMLARALSRRGIEVREILRLGERAFALGSDGALASDLSSWWAGVGEPARAAAILQRVEGRTSPDDRGAVWTRVGVLCARAGKGDEAARAFDAAMQAAPVDPLPAELLGSLHGWAAITGEVSAAAFLEAASRRAAAGDLTGAFEDCIRAFEACPSDATAAERLALALEERGRAGAAEEVLREHARRGSAAHRAAVHQRRFGRLLAEGDLYAAVGAALDAELDVGVELERLMEVLRSHGEAPPRDFESVFVHLAGQEEPIGQWLAAILDAAISAWGVDEVQRLRTLLMVRLPEQSHRFEIPTEIVQGEAEIQRRSAALREQLLRLGAASQEAVRLELARLQVARGAWRAAQEVLAPMLASGAEPSLEVACLAAVTAVRAGSPEMRARALLRIAHHAQGRWRATIASVAAELLLELGSLAEARAAAELAVEADPSWQRGIAAQALVAQRDPDASAGVLLERSLSVVLARSEACRVLAESSERRGALRLALTWTQRQLSQRPGDPEVARELLRRAAAAGDGERLADALSWLLSQPIPIAELATAVADALGALADQSTERAPEAAQRVLDVMGPRVEAVRNAIVHVARVCQLPELEAQVLERWLVTAPPETRTETYLDLARLRTLHGDVAAAARVLRRALSSGAPASEVSERLEALSAGEDSDAIVALLEARADVLWPESSTAERSGVEAEEARRESEELMRRLGAARWDLANDPQGAVDAWAALLEDPGVEAAEQFADDVRTFAGPELAASELERVARSAAPALCGRLLGLAAGSALEAQATTEAFRLAREALVRHPEGAEVLTIAEHAATSRDVDELVALYETLADATLGRYGERAVHYRAARQLEKRGRHDIALHHAVAAFEAAPAEGVAFVLMARLADRSGASDQVVGALERVASRARDPGSRVLWLERAAALADTSVNGRQKRIDVLLRALAVRPDSPTLATLVEAIRQLLEVSPEEVDVAQLRFERALDVLLPKVGGMDGSLFAVRAALASLELFDADELALRTLRRAAECDSDIEQFAELRPYTARLAAAPERARAFVQWCAERAGRRIVSLGRALAELAAEMAEILGESDARARLLARAALESPEDIELVRQAQRLAREVDDPELLLAVERILPADDRARHALRQAAQGDVDTALDVLLEIELAPLSPPVRQQVHLALAQRQEQIGRLNDAEASFKAVLALDGANVDALAGLERAAERRGDSEELARLLLRRAECTTDPAEIVDIRLRRASVLDTSLDRVEEARQELERLLSDRGDHPRVLRALAELYARGGSFSRAATLFTRASAAAVDDGQRAELSLLAAEAHLEAGQLDAARRIVDTAGIEPGSVPLVQLRVKIARKADDKRGLLGALIDLANVALEDSEEIGQALLEAARAAEELGDREQALKVAVRAAERMPDSAEAQLMARRLEYLTRGAGNAEQAATTVAQLRALTERLSHRQIELRAFLLAEALDVAEGGGAGLLELDRAVERVGSRALVAVGLAERLEGDPRRALQLLDAALGSDLHGLRGEGQVLIRAGRVARALEELDRAQAYLSAVGHDDPRQVEAAAELRQIAEERGRAERRAQERAEQQARARAEREAEAARQRAEEEARAEREAEAARQQRAEEEARVEAERQRQQRAEEERAASERSLARPQPTAHPSVRASVRASAHPTAPSKRSSLRPSGGRLLTGTVVDVREQELMGALQTGDAAAGHALLELFEGEASRSHDRLVVAEQLVALLPGDETALRQLAAAAEEERNGALSAAVRHVLGTFGVIPFEVAPAVSRLREQPDEVKRILTSGLQCPGLEAAAVVWDSVPHLFKQEPSAYGITGLERIAAGPLTPLSRLYADAARLLGAGRTPVFQRRDAESITLSVALLVPPSLLVSGEIEESSAELAFHFGAMLMATTPELAIVFGAEAAKVRLLLAALLAAFGPPSQTRPPPEVTRLAAALWESIPPRGQRRLSQLCATPEEFAYEKVTAVARQVLRRAGFVLCADLATAVVAACEEERLAPPRTLGELGDYCRHSAAVADLVRLALSPAYAEVRWNAQ